MSSSNRFPHWDDFSEREVPLHSTELLSPASEVMSVLQHYHADLAQARQDIERTRNEYLAALAQQAIFVSQFETRLHDIEVILVQASLERVYRTLRIMKDQMRSALHDIGIDIENPLDKPYDQVKDWVEVEGWSHREELKAEVVVEVLKPIITYRGTLLRLGQVIMGAPLLDNESPYTELMRSINRDA